MTSPMPETWQESLRTVEHHLRRRVGDLPVTLLAGAYWSPLILEGVPFPKAEALRDALILEGLPLLGCRVRLAYFELSNKCVKSLDEASHDAYAAGREQLVKYASRVPEHLLPFALAWVREPKLLPGLRSPKGLVARRGLEERIRVAVEKEVGFLCSIVNAPHGDNSWWKGPYTKEVARRRGRPTKSTVAEREGFERLLDGLDLDPIDVFKATGGVIGTTTEVVSITEDEPHWEPVGKDWVSAASLHPIDVWVYDDSRDGRRFQRFSEGWTMAQVATEEGVSRQAIRDWRENAARRLREAAQRLAASRRRVPTGSDAWKHPKVTSPDGACH